MTEEELAAIRERWLNPTGLYSSGTEEVDTRNVMDLLAEVDRLRAERDQWQLTAAAWEEEAFQQGEDFDRLRAEGQPCDHLSYTGVRPEVEGSDVTHWRCDGCGEVRTSAQVDGLAP